MALYKCCIIIIMSYFQFAQDLRRVDSYCKKWLSYYEPDMTLRTICFRLWRADVAEKIGIFEKSSEKWSPCIKAARSMLSACA